MASFGEELKRERELRDISLKEIAEATKISLRFLEALEEDNYDILPGGIFNRGFIRAYARFIGVDGEEMVNAYVHEMSQREARTAVAAAPPPPTPPATGVFRPENRVAAQRVQPRPDREARGRDIPPERRHIPRPPSRTEASDGRAPAALWGLAVAAILVVVAVVTVGLLRQRQSSSPADDLAQARMARATRKAGASAPRPAGSDAIASTVPGIASAEGAVPLAPTSASASDPTATPDSSAGGDTSSQTAAAPAPVEHTIRIQATEVTRVRLVCGSRLTLDQELWPGQARTMVCIEPVALGADNAGAIQYSVDNQPTALLGALGERVEEVQVAPPPTPPAAEPGSSGTASQTPGGVHGRR